jgi:hypothetical protein
LGCLKIRSQTTLNINTINPIETSAIALMAAISKDVRRMLGLSLHGWENAMVVSLIIAGFFALIAGAATWAVVRLQRIEIAESKIEFDKYKLDTGRDIAEANARALEARLALEKLKAPRSIPSSEIPRLIKLLSGFAGTNAAIYILGEGPEPNAISGVIADLLKKAKWDALSWNWSGVGAATGIVVLFKEGTEGQIGAACDALVAAFISVNLDAVKQQWPGDWDHFGGMLNGPNPPAPTAAPIRIVIGTKPQ